MEKREKLLDIPTEEQTPVVKELLGLVEELLVQNRLQKEQIQQLKDEIAILKGEKKRPKFKPSKLDSETDPSHRGNTTNQPRAGSRQKRKTQQLTIHEDKVIKPEQPVPPGARFKGYRDYIVQDIVISAHTTRYRLECWETPDGHRLTGRLPKVLEHSHFGPTLKSYILYQHHHCQVTQPLLLEQLHEWGIDISSGQINRLLLEDQEAFHAEKDALLDAGLAVSEYICVDDTGARHQGKNGYTMQIGNDLFAWFASTASKSRINFIELLQAGQPGYRINPQALDYLAEQQLPHTPLQQLARSPNQHFSSQTLWVGHLDELGIDTPRHRRIATEGALLGALLDSGFNPDRVIISDDAGQFNILRHALCWVHTERLVHKLISLNEAHRQDISQVRDQIWSFYRRLKAYKQNPAKEIKQVLEGEFERIFTQKTRYETLNQTLKRIQRNRTELLRVLEYPFIPLHTNGSESDIRDYVKKRKVSGGTRSDAGQQCRDTFASLKKTCRKLGISFWEYLIDRIHQNHKVPLLPDRIRQQVGAPGY